MGTRLQESWRKKPQGHAKPVQFRREIYMLVIPTLNEHLYLPFLHP